MVQHLLVSAMFKLFGAIILCSFVCQVYSAPTLASMKLQIDALQEFYNATDGDNWDPKCMGWSFSKNSGGNYKNNPCNPPVWKGIKCNQKGVTSLSLPECSLVGTIPSELAKLLYLTELNLSTNYITGSIPSQLSLISQLKILSLYDNSISGSIPESLWGLTALTDISLGANYLCGNISTSISNMCSLNVLELSSNSISGSIPKEMWGLHNLKSIILSQNRISGTISPLIGGMTSLSLLILYDNSISGPIPDEMWGLTALTVLSLGANKLCANISTSIGNMHSLKNLQLYENSISGSIPKEMWRLTNLTDLVLSNNKLCGSLHRSIGGMASLTYLDLNSNSLSGPIPDEMWGLHYLTSIDLYENRISGTISPLIGGMTSLVGLSLYNNSISGSLPDEMWNLHDLPSVALNGNRIIGTISPVIGGMTALTYLNLNTNSIHGSIPESIWGLLSLNTLLLYLNDLSGTISPSIGQMTSLRNLRLESNSLSGPIPEEMWNLQNLTALGLSNNKLSGSLSPMVGAMHSLASLNLENNQLKGSLPSELSRMLQLRYLGLGNNLFISTIPSVLSRLSGIKDIQFSGNMLIGTIPPAFGTMRQLERIDLSSNRLSGTVPITMLGLKLLQVLRLSGNKLEGSVPSEICKLSRSLDTFDLSGNELSGSVPSCLSVLGALQTLILSKNQFTNDGLTFLLAPNLTTIDISMNGFRGALPAALFLSTKLKIFAAASNCFQGSLPASICKASSLEVLVLDGLSAGSTCRKRLWGSKDSTPLRLTGFKRVYKMSGTLPACVFAFPNITTLHLSGNGFAGKIPSQVSSWPAALRDLTLSHNQLTGPIPDALQSIAGQFLNFDLSFNKLDGLLTAMRISNRTIVSLTVNRFSGLLSPSVVTAPAGHISVLEGSLVDCDDRATQLPSSDPYITRFKCGSDTFNNYLIAFAVLLVSICLVLLRFGKSFRGIAEYINPSIPTIDACIQQILLSLRHVRLYCVVIFGALVFFLIPAYSVLSFYRGNHTFLYAWTASAAFKSGVQSAAVLLALWSLFLSCNLWYFLSSAHNPRGFDSDNKIKGSDDTSIRSRTAVRLLLIARLMLIFLLNAVGTIAPNLGYVIVVSLFASNAQAAASLSLTVYKLVWSTLVVPRILKSRSLYFGVLPHEIDLHGLASLSGGLVFDLFLSAFSSVIAPCISLMVIDSNCFKEALWAPHPISSSYTTDVCRNGLTYTTETLNGVTTPYEKLFTTCSAINQYQSYEPSFQYNYQCSSTLLQTYSPVFLLMALYSAFGEPLLHFICRLCVRRFPSWSWLLRLIPRIMHTRLERETADLRRLQRQGRQHFESERTCRVLDHQRFVRGVIQDAMLLLTFGTVAPLLGITVLASLLSKSLRWHHWIVGFLSNDDEVNGGGVAELTADCREISLGLGNSNAYSTGLFIVAFASVFLSFFLEDVAGDRVGWKRTVWAPISMWFLPLCIGLIAKAVTRSKPKSAPNIELPEVEMSNNASSDLHQRHSSNPMHDLRLQGSIVDEVPERISASASMSGENSRTHQDFVAASLKIDAHSILLRPSLNDPAREPASGKSAGRL